MKKLTHINQKGDAQLVDITDKAITHRKAIAEGTIQLNEETLRLIQANSIKKGDVLNTAKIAGIQAAKKTWELIPLCHSISLTKIDINFIINKKNNTFFIRLYVISNFDFINFLGFSMPKQEILLWIK